MSEALQICHVPFLFYKYWWAYHNYDHFTIYYQYINNMEIHRPNYPTLHIDKILNLNLVLGKHILLVMITYSPSTTTFTQLISYLH